MSSAQSPHPKSKAWRSPPKTSLGTALPPGGVNLRLAFRSLPPNFAVGGALAPGIEDEDGPRKRGNTEDLNSGFWGGRI